MSVMRLDKFLSNLGVGTRSEVKVAIKKKQVRVNGEIAVKSDIKIDPDRDTVYYMDEKLHYEEYEYYMLHKPKGYVSATEDPIHKTVMELIPSKKNGLFPVGRLDKDTEGLLLITNDGQMAHNLLSPKKHVDKTYYARIEGKVTREDVLAFQKGVDIGESNLTLPAKLEIHKSDDTSMVSLTIKEGKFHQVKRMFEAVGKKVIYLKRLSMGTLFLDPNLPVGQVRPLTPDEISLLKTIDKSY